MPHPVDNKLPRAANPQSATSGPPIFLTGFARSGTTWVNRLIRDYFDVGLVNEGQFIVSFGRNLAKYGDLHVISNFDGLIRKLAQDRFFFILKVNYGIEIDWIRVKRCAGSFSEIVINILEQIAERMGKRRIGSKYPVFGRYVPMLNKLFPNCRLIHVVRDGRDCALSQKKVTWGHQNTYAAAIHWRAYLDMVRRDTEALGDRYLELRYEDLLLQPRSAIAVLERFITSSTEGLITRRFLEDSTSLKSEKVGGWRQAMPARDQAIFESTAGDLLQRYGYPLTGRRHSPSFLLRLGYVAHDRISRESMQWARKLFRNLSEYKA